MNKQFKVVIRGAAMMLGLAAAMSAPAAGASAAEPAASSAPAFTPPPADSIPDDAFGKMVRKGQDIFLLTPKYAGKYVGNSLNCVSCHMDAGRRAGASPMWAAYVLYPQFRSKNGHVNTLAERLQGCFRFSMDGAVPPADSQTIAALETYLFWLAKGARTGVKQAGPGFRKLSPPPQPADYVRGQKVFEQHCVLCHGANGQGQHAGGHMVFPALWGDDSYNWGAGMHSVTTAAAFIKANMPLGKGGTLSDQEAWDVAYFVDAHERPQDPRFNGSLEETRKKFHDSSSDLYGQKVNGVLLGEHSTPPGGRLRKTTAQAGG
jgi:thiosulfate dehydrogenase